MTLDRQIASALIADHARRRVGSAAELRAASAPGRFVAEPDAATPAVGVVLGASEQRNATCGDVVDLRVLAVDPARPAASAGASAHPAASAGASVDPAERIAVRWHGRGCTVSQASASMLAELVEGRTAAEAAALVVELRALIRSHELRPGAEDRLGDAFALADSGRYPLRGTCALLAWHALEEALGR
ncbi:iron-sulfur cluster assembly scaffold protein [Clavibacter michiganensis]|uniref:iron-sulfur cluster assembly scaffold protein n=1 Tax=Clavibacter michiganensis TaxID=28447 RepID=UPI001BDFED08|nr:iron-sulfur cluster assembly scaffold protein [Clavibacter michiganensis]MBT1635889.1 iron-sulfur cluster assembly scaffold protein [Clavibacter michiganensis]